MLIKFGNRIINDSYIVSYTFTQSKGVVESLLTIMLSMTQKCGKIDERRCGWDRD